MGELLPAAPPLRLGYSQVRRVPLGFWIRAAARRFPGAGLVRSGPCPRGLPRPPGVRLSRAGSVLVGPRDLPLGRSGPGSLHVGSRPREPRVNPCSHPDPGPGGLCIGLPPVQPEPCAPDRAYDDPSRYVGRLRASSPRRHSSSDRALPRPDFARDQDCHLNVPGPPTGSPGFPGTAGPVGPGTRSGVNLAGP